MFRRCCLRLYAMMLPLLPPPLYYAGRHELMPWLRATRFVYAAAAYADAAMMRLYDTPLIRYDARVDAAMLPRVMLPLLQDARRLISLSAPAMLFYDMARLFAVTPATRHTCCQRYAASMPLPAYGALRHDISATLSVTP